MTAPQQSIDTLGLSLELFKRRFLSRADRYLVEAGDEAEWRRETVTDELLIAHLRGEKRIGLGIEPEHVLYVLADFDGKNRAGGVELALQEALRFAAIVDADAGLVTLLEISRSCAGYHAWVFFDPGDLPTLDEARRFVKLALASARLPADGDESKGHPGIFPHPPGPKNVGRVPFLPWSGFMAGRKGGRFVDANGRAFDNQCAALSDVRLITRAELLRATECLDVQPVPDESADWRDADQSEPSASNPDEIRKGQRDTTLTSLAGAMRRRRASEGAILAALLHENKSRCKPPLSEAQVRKIARSISTYAPGPAEASRDEAPTRRLVVVQMAELIDTPLQPVDWITSGIVARGKTTGLAAQRKRGKSKFCHALVLDIAAEREVALRHESFRILTSGPVLWLDMEQGRNELTMMSHRLMAGSEYDESETRKIRERIFWVHRQPIDFNDARWLTAIQQQVQTEGIILTVVDSISAVQAFYGSENDNAGRRRLYNNVIAPLLDLGSGVLTLGHTPIKSKDSDPEAEMRTRGGGDILGTVDSSLFIVGTRHEREHGDRGRIMRTIATLGTLESRGSDFDRCRIVMDGPAPLHDEIPGPLAVYAEPIVRGAGGEDVRDVNAVARAIVEAVAGGPRFRPEVARALALKTSDRLFREAEALAEHDGRIEVRKATEHERARYRREHSKGGAVPTVLEATE